MKGQQQAGPSHPAPQMTQGHATLAAQLDLISALESVALHQLHRERPQPGLQEAVLPPRAADGGWGRGGSAAQPLRDCSVREEFGPGPGGCRRSPLWHWPGSLQTQGKQRTHARTHAGTQSQVESHPSERKRGRHTHRHTYTHPRGMSVSGLPKKCSSYKDVRLLRRGYPRCQRAAFSPLVAKRRPGQAHTTNSASQVAEGAKTVRGWQLLRKGGKTGGTPLPRTVPHP